MSYVLGIDLGTSSLKGLVLNKNGEIVETEQYSYPLIQEKIGYSEQNPKFWVEALENVINNLSSKISDFTENLEGISFSGQMHSLVLLDKCGKVLRNAILWNDVRTTAECNEIMKDSLKLFEITKNRALEGFTLPKIMWVQKNEKEIWDNVRHILLPKDYLSFWLTGEYVTDYSDASGTLLLDLNKNEWSSYQLEKYDIPKEYMPKLLGSYELVGTIKDELKTKFNFKKNIKIFAGGADNACAALTTGIYDENKAMVSIGTSGVFLTLENNVDKEYNGKLHVFNHVIKGLYYSMGVTLSAGHSLEWFRKTFAKNSNFNELLEKIDEIPAGSNGLLFTPYIVGERTPHIDANIRGSFIGIDTSHNLNHFTKSVVEGITFSLKDSQELINEITNKKINEVISIGGGAKNKKWLQLQADIFGLNVKTVSVEQGPSLGAAMLSALGLSWYKNELECIKLLINYSNSYTPDNDKKEKYKNIYGIYKKIYDNTNLICKEINNKGVRNGNNKG